MDIWFERAVPSDAQTLVAIQIAAFHHDSVVYPGVAVGGPPGYDSVENLVDKIQHSICYKIMQSERCIGGIVVFDEGEGHLHLDLLYIEPDYHNQGIGTNAIQFLEAQHPAQKWTLDTPQYAIRNQHFYEKFGYSKVGEFFDGEVMLFSYEKQISPD